MRLVFSKIQSLSDPNVVFSPFIITIEQPVTKFIYDGGDQAVEFEVEAGPKGPQASKVKKL